MRTCAHCEGSLEGRRSNALFCSRRCKEQSRKARGSIRHARAAENPNLRTAICQHCEAPFTAGLRGRVRAFCTNECARAAYNENRGPMRSTCAYCGSEYAHLDRYTHRRYCSDRCRQGATNAAQRAKRQGIGTPLQLRQMRRATHNRIAARRDAIDRAATSECRSCSTQIPAMSDDIRQVRMYCSRECKERSAVATKRHIAKNHVRRARIRGSEHERIDRDRLWTRDGGRCHICGKKADPSNWHIDHIIPIVLEGPHTYANVAVSHPSCNLAKGARAVGDQLRLVG